MNPGEQATGRGGRRAWVVWGVALSVYVLAVFHRSSLGVAGLMASERFGILASQLSLLIVLQLLMYAVMQVPMGVLIDRFGARRMLLSGLVLLTVGQLGFGLATSFRVALCARVLVGLGDAAVFISVLRVVATWFRVRQVPLVTQLTGQVGQLGAILAAAPLTLALHRLGWTASFTYSALFGVLVMACVIALVRDSPAHASREHDGRLTDLIVELRVVWANPGTRLAMWSALTVGFAPITFALLWGYPFLVGNQGLHPGPASALLTVAAASNLVSGPVLAWAITRFPAQRSIVVLGVVAAMSLNWAVVLAWPGPAPLPVVVSLVLVTATGGPAALVGFDIIRSFNTARQLGRASGIVNVGVYLGSLTMMAGIGLLLDLVSAEGDYQPADFRLAMTAQFVLWGLGAFQILRYRRRAIAALPRHG